VAQAILHALASISPVPACGAQAVLRRDSLQARSMSAASIRDYLRLIDNLSHRGNVEFRTAPDLHMPRAMAAADTVLAVLDSAANLSPRDRDIFNLRVYNRVVRGRMAEARDLVNRSCLGQNWWCAALSAFVQHAQQNFEGAERSYDLALSLMPAATRCLWDDVSQVMNDVGLTKYYRRLSCNEQSSLNARIWWLADPLWIEPGNDRRTEHYYRWTMAELVRGELEFIGWRRFRTDVVSDPLEAYLRVGTLMWYNGMSLGCWERGKLWCNHSSDSPVRSDRYLPVLEAVLQPFSFGEASHELAARIGGTSGREGADVPSPDWHRTRSDQFDPLGRNTFSHPHGELFSSSFGRAHTMLDAQAAVLLRGSRALVLAAFSPRVGVWQDVGAWFPACVKADMPLWCFSPAPYQAALRSSAMRAGVAVSVAGGAMEVAVAQVDGGLPARFGVPASFDSAIVSLEARSLPQRNDAPPADDAVALPALVRHRFAVFRPGRSARSRVKSSDVVLFDAASDSDMKTADQALAAMIPRTTVGATETVGLYWELYNLRPGDSPEFELSVAPTDTSAGLLRFAAQSIGLASRPATVLTSWKGPRVTDTAIGPFSETRFLLRIGFGALSPGMYMLTLASRVEGDSAVRVSRAIRVK
jgi:hypothetical protein